jgi:hypothetical protein
VTDLPPQGPTCLPGGPAPRAPILSRASYVVLVGWLVTCVAVVAVAGWSPGDEYHPELGVGEGLAAMGTLALLGAPVVLPAAVLVRRRSALARVVAVLLLGVAGFFGLVVGVVVGAGRCTTCDDA